MYERSAIVLEKCFNSFFGFDKKINLKVVLKNFKDIIQEYDIYQNIIEEEDKIIFEFDEVANNIRKIQQEQKKIFKANIKLEDDRNQLFDNIDEDSALIEKKLNKIEDNINRNNIRFTEIKNEFIENVSKFNEKQIERNKHSRTRREAEGKYLQLFEKSQSDINQIDNDILNQLEHFASSDDNEKQREIVEIMLGNGKDEKVPFDEDVVENAVRIRSKIAKKEAECYVSMYERFKKLLLEINNDNVKLDKYNKFLRDINVKLAFLNAIKNYIFSFLDNERMTSLNGVKVHKKLMTDACEKFGEDIEQFNKLYDLIIKEIQGKATRKAYSELYNKEYLKNIEEKEKNFVEEVNSFKIKSAAIINSNYWRIDEIKNIYEVFQKEVSEKFDKDLSEFKLEEIDENNSRLEERTYAEDDIFKTTEVEDDDYKNNEYYDDNEEISNDVEEKYDDENDDEEYEDEDDEDEDEYDNEDDEDEDKYDNEDDEDEDEYDNEDDEDEDEYDNEDDEDEDEYDNEDDDDDDEDEDEDDDDDDEDEDDEEDDYEDDDDEDYEDEDEEDYDDDEDYDDEDDYEDDDDEDYEDEDEDEEDDDDEDDDNNVEDGKTKKQKKLFNGFFKNKNKKQK